MSSRAWDVLLYAFAAEQKDEDAVHRALDEMQAAVTTQLAADVAPRIIAQLHTRKAVRRHRLGAGHASVELLPPAKASDERTLRDFLDATYEEGAPRATALILYGHGSGLDNVYRRRAPRARHFHLHGAAHSPVARGAAQQKQKQLGPDPLSGEFLTNHALRDAIAHSRRRAVDVLAFNACSMAMLEVAEELRDVAAIQLASQVEATLWPYGALTAALSAAPRLSAEGFAQALVHAVREQLARQERHDTLAAFRSAEVARLTRAFFAYAARAVELLPEHGEDIITAVMVEAQRVYDPYQIDLLSLTTRLAGRLRALSGAADDVSQSFAAAHLASAAHRSRGDVHGLSLFCPMDLDVVLTAPYAGTRFEDSAWSRLLGEMHRLLAAY